MLHDEEGPSDEEGGVPFPPHDEEDGPTRRGAYSGPTTTRRSDRRGAAFECPCWLGNPCRGGRVY